MTTEILIADLRILTGEFGALLTEESNAIHTAQFARAISLQDRKIRLHTRLNPVLEAIKAAPKSDAQREAIRDILTALSLKANVNKRAIEHGFSALERLLNRVFGAMRRTLQQDTPRYTASGAYHQNRRQTLTMQTDRIA